MLKYEYQCWILWIYLFLSEHRLTLTAPARDIASERQRDIGRSRQEVRERERERGGEREIRRERGRVGEWAKGRVKKE